MLAQLLANLFTETFAGLLLVAVGRGVFTLVGVFPYALALLLAFTGLLLVAVG
jgi:hypothetical protein